MDADVFHPSDAIEVRRVVNRGKGGRGVFARSRISAGETIERVPVILIPRGQVFDPNPEHQKASRISWYVFNWIECKRDYVALALGYGSIYNHSADPNARFEMQHPDILSFIALRDIDPREEIFIDYRGSGSKTALGFEVLNEPTDDRGDS